MTNYQDRIKEAIDDALKNKPGGMRTAELTKGILYKRFSKLKHHLIYTVLKDYAQDPKANIYWHAYGLFRHKNFKDEPIPGGKQPHINESLVYEPFADFLVASLGECTKAIRLGGNRMRNWFGTPDVIGIRKLPAESIFTFPVEIVSAEIKTATDASVLIKAFGQACSYRLFSHKSYIVVPKNSNELERLESLCLLFGIGLILVDLTNERPDPTDFEIRTRAVRHEPDMFYVNLKITPLAKELGLPTPATSH
jgi:hypothetical protein